MTQIPRLALATPPGGTEPSAAALAWLAGLSERQWRVQHFRSRACPAASQVVCQLTGSFGRHLDPWLMPEPDLRDIFARGARRAEIALVEGTFDNAKPVPDAPCAQPGRLAPIARTLDLPVVAVVRCSGRADFHLPPIPDAAGAVFLDGLERPEDFEFARRMVTLTTKKPVIGAVEAVPGLHDAPAGSPFEHEVSEETRKRLAASFLRFADLNAIRALARSRPFPWATREPPPCGGRRFRVAYAQDEAFGAYFPDTLDALESLGADLVEFSPLRDGALPDRVNLVLIGCGFPDHFADALAENVSMTAALREHVCRGQRIYSEGGGTAYLGRSMVLGDRVVPGAAILPFDAHLLPNAPPPAPVTRVLNRNCWLGPAGTVVRGYMTNRWRLVPGADPLDCPSCFGPLTEQNDFYFHHHAVGGMVHLHLGALREVVDAFAGPHPASLSLPSARP